MTDVQRLREVIRGVVETAGRQPSQHAAQAVDLLDVFDRMAERAKRTEAVEEWRASMQKEAEEIYAGALKLEKTLEQTKAERDAARAEVERLKQGSETLAKMLDEERAELESVREALDDAGVRALKHRENQADRVDALAHELKVERAKAARMDQFERVTANLANMKELSQLEDEVERREAELAEEKSHYRGCEEAFASLQQEVQPQRERADKAEEERDKARDWVNSLAKRKGCWAHGDEPSGYCPYCGVMGALVTRAEAAETQLARLRGAVYPFAAIGKKLEIEAASTHAYVPAHTTLTIHRAAFSNLLAALSTPEQEEGERWNEDFARRATDAIRDAADSGVSTFFDVSGERIVVRRANVEEARDAQRWREAVRRLETMREWDHVPSADYQAAYDVLHGEGEPEKEQAPLAEMDPGEMARKQATLRAVQGELEKEQDPVMRAADVAEPPLPVNEPERTKEAIRRGAEIARILKEQPQPTPSEERVSLSARRGALVARRFEGGPPLTPEEEQEVAKLDKRLDELDPLNAQPTPSAEDWETVENAIIKLYEGYELDAAELRECSLEALASLRASHVSREEVAKHLRHQKAQARRILDVLRDGPGGALKHGNLAIIQLCEGLAESLGVEL